MANANKHFALVQIGEIGAFIVYTMMILKHFLCDICKFLYFSKLKNLCDSLAQYASLEKKSLKKNIAANHILLKCLTFIEKHENSCQGFPY